MPVKRVDTIYDYFDEDSPGTEFRCKLAACDRLVKRIASKGVTNLQRHLKTHADVYQEYETQKDEKEKSATQEKLCIEQKQRTVMTKITDHLPVQSCSQLSALHSRQRQFIRNLVACAAEPNQSMHFFTREHKLGRSAPFRTLLAFADSSLHVPSQRTLTRHIHKEADEYKTKVCTVALYLRGI
jgi:hypothetical protein